MSLTNQEEEGWKQEGGSRKSVKAQGSGRSAGAGSFVAMSAGWKSQCIPGYLSNQG